MLSHKCFMVSTEEFKNPPFSLIWKILEPFPKKNSTGLPLLLLFLLPKPRTSTWESGQEQAQISRLGTSTQ